MRISDWSSDVCSSDLSQPKVEGWHSPVLHLGEDGQAVRINFTYRNGGTRTAARFSVKARSLQYTEGPHERRYFRFLETDYRVCDFQFKIERIERLTSKGFSDEDHRIGKRGGSTVRCWWCTTNEKKKKI